MSERLELEVAAEPQAASGVSTIEVKQEDLHTEQPKGVK